MHALAREIADTYLSLADSTAPGLVEGLYLTGSTVLGDFHPKRSDIDFVAVSTAPPRSDQLAGLERAHAELASRYRRPFFNGPYLTWEELAAAPAKAAAGPRAAEGRLRHHDLSDRDPVLWHTLARHGAALRGPGIEDLTVHTDQDELTAWTVANLDEYWRPWWRQSSRFATWQGVASLTEWGPPWGVLGISRMHCTLATGRIVSKRAAGDYARAAFYDRWHRIVDECLRIRRGDGGRSRYRTPFSRRSAALAFMDMAIDDAHRIARS